MANVFQIKILLTIAAILSGLAVAAAVSARRDRDRLEHDIQFRKEVARYQQTQPSGITNQSKAFHEFRMP
jgi:hypothetical protein